MQAEILLYDNHSLKTLNVIVTRQVCCRFYLSVSNYEFIKGSETDHIYPWSRVLLEKPTGFQIVKKFPTFYGTRRFITTFPSARHLYISWANLIQFILPHLTFWRSILILSSHLRLCSPSGLLPSDFPIKTLYTPLLSPYALHAQFS
jgi:hypothetical protein